MRLRPAADADASLLFDWVNDEHVRAMSLSPEPVAWADHCNWLAGKLADPACRLYIAVNDEQGAVGQIRFELLDEVEAEVHVYTRPDLRGQGSGTRIIGLGLSRLFAETNVKTVHAIVKTENIGSKRAFEKMGFHHGGDEIHAGQQCAHMLRYREAPSG